MSGLGRQIHSATSPKRKHHHPRKQSSKRDFEVPALNRDHPNEVDMFRVLFEDRLPRHNVSMNEQESDDTYRAEEAELRRDAVVRQMARTPSKPRDRKKLPYRIIAEGKGYGTPQPVPPNWA